MSPTRAKRAEQCPEEFQQALFEMAQLPECVMYGLQGLNRFRAMVEPLATGIRLVNDASSERGCSYRRGGSAGGGRGRGGGESLRDLTQISVPAGAAG